ncbi:MAG TPA: pyridoxal 5'-phosphate synthase glutaminase subunit PdxT [Methylomusa anaerophila]|nr:pyridoxal 5'-phosphate synthase glutaminase subunit PdxT [Methylomusa anaerophila]HML88199.1 pyridoxal 5'-phosphate synthase glutaminase subunit PdxT [Methylomusa anaerophila]
MTIGVLALQGAVKEHLDRLNSLPDVAGLAVKKAADLNNIDGLILPGGESTTIGKLLREFNLSPILIDKINRGLPVWGTCAGMILLAKAIIGEETRHLGVMDICVRRNAYGSQLDSFATELVIPKVSSSPVPLVFIRAPYVEETGKDVQILARVDGKIVAVEQGNMLATAFHPELTDDLTFHRYFAEKVRKNKNSEK